VSLTASCINSNPHHSNHDYSWLKRRKETENAATSLPKQFRQKLKNGWFLFGFDYPQLFLPGKIDSTFTAWRRCQLVMQ
jgi:hypothetical protein